MKKPLKTILFLGASILISFFSVMAQVSDNAEKLYQQVLENPPAPAEARVIGKKIDLIFKAISQIDSQFAEAVTKIKWGDVYDPKALNQPKKLAALIKVNSKSLELAKKAFDEREKIFTQALKDLAALAEKSLFAKAMSLELKDRYEAAETGFKAINEEMRATTIAQHGLIDRKLKMLAANQGSYKMLEVGKIAFAEEEKGKALMAQYQRNNQEHNQTTARQRQVGEFFVKNHDAVLERFRELSK